jgi:hypothetical protein
LIPIIPREMPIGFHPTKNSGELYKVPMDVGKGLLHLQLAVRLHEPTSLPWDVTRPRIQELSLSLVMPLDVMRSVHDNPIQAWILDFIFSTSYELG